MDMQILVSKKGTQVITASNLHGVLKLPDHKYNANVQKWMMDIYAFEDDVRKPIDMKDFSVRKLEMGKHRDFYLSLELARLITLNSESLVKQKIAKQFLELEGKEQNTDTYSKEQITAVLEITKAMGLVSCQKTVEEQHLARFEQSHKGLKDKNYEWWNYRAKLLGYSVKKLKNKMEEIGQNYKGKSLRSMLMYLDKYEIIRMAVVDLFIALGRNESYAKNMGDLAKIFGKELNVQIWDDRNSAIDFSKTTVNPQLLLDLKSFNKANLYI